ncbi:MAG: HepT-like ribonuclease domain-containing protein [Candidatus Jordarchaeaceae archaeon]
MDVNRKVIEGKIDIIERNLRFLEQYKEIGLKEFEKSYKDVQAVKYSLLEIVEACVDIANHIISVRGYRRAEKYSEIFQILGEENVISPELSEKMQKMAKFRRRKYLINKPVQIGYFGLTAWFICLGILLVGSITYYFTLNTIINEIQIASPAFDTVEVVNKINLMLQKKLALVFAVLIVIAAILVILYLHRVVGPVFRIEKTLRESIEGKPFQSIRLRKKDSFKSLAETINIFVANYESKIQKVKDVVQEQIPDSEKIEKIKEIFKD